MRSCPNCSQTASDDRKICRNCGGILVDAAEELEVAAVVLPETVEPDQSRPSEEPRDDTQESLRNELTSFPERVPEDQETDEDDEHAESREWKCPQCHVRVPRSFDLCWNCQTPRPSDVDAPQEGMPIPGPPTPPPVEAEVVEAQLIEEHDVRRSTCATCGSSKIMRDVVIRDQGDGTSGMLNVVIPGNPGALVFKDRRFGKVYADICGQCGHIQLRVKNPASLYAHYMKARKRPL